MIAAMQIHSLWLALYVLILNSKTVGNACNVHFAEKIFWDRESIPLVAIPD